MDVYLLRENGGVPVSDVNGGSVEWKNGRGGAVGKQCAEKLLGFRDGRLFTLGKRRGFNNSLFYSRLTREGAEMEAERLYNRSN